MIADSHRTMRAGRIPVLMVAQQFGLGGIERDVSKLSRHVSAYGIDPHVASFRPGGARWKEIERAGIPTVEIPLTSFKSPSLIAAARRLKSYITEHDIQVLHAFDAMADLFAVPCGRLFGVPSLASQLWHRNFLSRTHQWLLSIVDKVATGIFVNSYAAADELADDWHVPRKKIHICHNGFEPSEFHPKGRKRPAPLAEASVVIGTVAVLREEKRVELLVEAFAKVHSVDPRARLLIVGDGPRRAGLVAHAQQLGLGSVCIFEGATATPADWMRAIDVFVLCSRSESFPNALLEAMGCGCCPVGSRVGGIAELVTHGETGLLFECDNMEELADALCRLAQDWAQRSRLAEAAARFVHEQLTIEIAASRLANIYKQLLGRETEQSEHPEAVTFMPNSGASSV